MGNAEFEVQPSDHVGRRWRSSRPKILKGLSGYCSMIGLESSNHKCERKREAEGRAIIDRAKELMVYERSGLR
jgi:hypothetical protein